MKKDIKLIIILSIPIICSLIEWKFSYSTMFIIVSMILLYILIKGKNTSYKNKYVEKLYKIYQMIMILFLTSFIFLQTAILVNMYKTKNIDNIKHVDTMIVLGAKVNENGISKTLKLRLDKAIEYYNKNKDIKIIVSGGQSDKEVITEALAMRNYLVKNNVDENKIILEDKATTTLENIIFSKKIMENLKLENNVLIVTSDYHLFRSQFIASIFGIKNQGLCSTTSLSGRIYYMIREYSTSIVDLYRSVKINYFN